MAEKEKKTMGEVVDPNKKIGSYTEAAGGGTPIKKGEHFEVADTTEEARRLKKQGVKNVRVNQPRDEDGQFTYNSANKRPLKYGPSRGTTLPPFLRGMKMTWSKKSHRGAIVTDDGTYKLPDGMDAESFIRAFQEYRIGKGFGEFGKMDSAAQKRAGRSSKQVETVGGEGRAVARKEKTGEVGGKKFKVLLKPGDAADFVNKWTDNKNEWAERRKANGSGKMKWARAERTVNPGQSVNKPQPKPTAPQQPAQQPAPQQKETGQSSGKDQGQAPAQPARQEVQQENSDKYKDLSQDSKNRLFNFKNNK